MQGFLFFRFVADDAPRPWQATGEKLAPSKAQ